MALHLAAMLVIHGTLYACFVNERKHKEVKRYSNVNENFTAATCRTILVEMLHIQVESLQASTAYPTKCALLISPRHAPSSLQRSVQSALGTNALVWTSRYCKCSSYTSCAQGDVVLFSGASEISVGQVKSHLMCDGICYSLLCEWHKTGVAHIFNPSTDGLLLIRSEDILETCIYRVDSESRLAYVVEPARLDVPMQW